MYCFSGKLDEVNPQKTLVGSCRVVCASDVPCLATFLAGGSSKPTAGADVVKSDESDWEHWQEVIDKADAEDQILTALEVRPSSSSRRETRLFSGTSRS